MSDQIEFDFNAPRPASGKHLPEDPLERGYRAFQAEQVRAVEALEQRFGVVLNRRVRVTLHGWEDEFVGKLRVDQLLHPTRRGDPLRLRVGSVSFDYTDIATCVVLPEGVERSG